MTQLAFVVEGYKAGIDRLIQALDGKFYQGGKAKVRVRIALPLILTVNECGKQDLLNDLLPIIHNKKNNPSYNEKKGFVGAKESGLAARNSLLRILKWARRLFPSAKSIDKDLEKAQDSGFVEENRKNGNHFLCNLYPLGEIIDVKINGVEIV